MNTSDRPLANPVAVLREEFDDWAVLFNPDTAEALGINPIGVAIWKKLDGKRTFAEIADEIRRDFESVPATAPDEIREFVTALADKGFVGYELKSVKR